MMARIGEEARVLGLEITNDRGRGHRVEPALRGQSVQLGEHLVAVAIIHVTVQRVVEPLAHGAHRLAVADDVGDRHTGELAAGADAQVIDIAALAAGAGRRMEAGSQTGGAYVLVLVADAAPDLGAFHFVHGLIV